MQRQYNGPRTNHSFSLYRGAFGEAPLETGLLLDLGAGDSEFSRIAKEQHEVKVVALDPQYASLGTEYRPAVAADGRALPFTNDSFDGVVNVLMMRQLPHNDGSISEAIKEMIRVTKPIESLEQEGTINIFPVYRPDRKGVLKYFLDLEDKIADVSYPNFDYLTANHPRFVYPTLRIAKRAATPPEYYHELAHAIEESKILKPYPGIKQLGRSVHTLLTGKTIFDTPD